MNDRFPTLWPIHVDTYRPDAPFLAWMDSGPVRIFTYAELLDKSYALLKHTHASVLDTAVVLPLKKREPQHAILAGTHLLSGVPFSIPNETGGSRVGSKSLLDDQSAMDQVMITLETSGTTGEPKTVAISRRQIDHAVRWFPAPFHTAAGEYWGHALPLHHVGGLSILARAISTGGGVAFAKDTSVEAIQELLTSVPLKGISLVATQLQRLLKHSDSVERLSTLDAILLGGGPLPLEVAEQALEHDLPIYQSYGMTETFAMIAAHRLSDTPGEPQCIGKPFGDTEIMLRNGTLHLRGTQIGTTSTRQSSRQSSPGQGSAGQGSANTWFDTGDLGNMDEHARWIIEARRDDLILSGGNNIVPARVEQALIQHPGIEAALVLGVDDPEWGQRVVAIVEPTPTAEESMLTPNGLDAWLLKSPLNPYEFPKDWVILSNGESIPRTALGKLARNQARSLLEKR